MVSSIMDLTDDIIISILSFLPFSSLHFGAKNACKRWYRLASATESKQLTSWCILSCPARLDSPRETLSRWGSVRREYARSGSVIKALSRSRSSRRRPCSDNSGNFHVVMFDPSTRKWMKVRNPFGYEGRYGSPGRELLWVPSTGGYSGLVCVFEWKEESCHKTNTYWVGNPITNDWQCIAGPSPWRGVHQLVVDPVTKTFKIISIRWEQLLTAEGPQGVWRAAIYDSKENKWRYGANWNTPRPLFGRPFRLSSRTHTASDKMMYLLMHRTGRLLNWETYTEIQILGYDIQKDEFKFVTPLSEFNHCLEYFEPTSCREWPVHLVLKADELSANYSGNAMQPSAKEASSQRTSTVDPAGSACPVLLVTCSTLPVRRKGFERVFQLIANAINGKPRAFHKEFQNKLCISEFNSASGSWDVKEESCSQVTGKFYSNVRVFHCAGDRLEHLYYAHVDEHQSVVVYNAKKDDFSTWTRLPPLGDEYGGCITKNYHSLGSFTPRFDATPCKPKEAPASASLDPLVVTGARSGTHLHLERLHR